MASEFLSPGFGSPEFIPREFADSDSENVDHGQHLWQHSYRFARASFAHTTGENPGLSYGVYGDWGRKLCPWLETRHKRPANPKSDSEEAVFNADRVLSTRRKRISHVSVLLHCFVATEQMREIKLAVITTASCLIKLKLREHLCKIEF